MINLPVKDGPYVLLGTDSISKSFKNQKENYSNVVQFARGKDLPSGTVGASANMIVWSMSYDGSDHHLREISVQSECNFTSDQKFLNVSIYLKVKDTGKPSFSGNFICEIFYWGKQ